MQLVVDGEENFFEWYNDIKDLLKSTYEAGEWTWQQIQKKK
jgi:hypothetical protein